MADPSRQKQNKLNMKKYTIITLSLFLLISCSPKYYQVYKTTSTDNVNIKGNSLSYEDSNCIISYNFWNYGGDVGFSFYNKTDKNIYINLEESFYIFNGIANDYYKNRTYSNSKSTSNASTRNISFGKSVFGKNYLNVLQSNFLSFSNSNTNIVSSGYTEGNNEKSNICIPPKTRKEIVEYKINQNLYSDCDLPNPPNKRGKNSKTFSADESPIKFGNIIAYKIANNDNLLKIENNFYVSEISNIPEKEMFEYKNTEDCGKKSALKSKFMKDIAPNKFYITYTLQTNY